MDMTLALHTLHPSAGAKKKKKRIGRGNASGHGTYSTRGMKGQRARSGGRSGLKKLGMKRIIASLPKLGGFVSRHPKAHGVSVVRLARVAKTGDVITLSYLKKRKLVPSDSSRAKILQPGKIDVVLTIGPDISCSAGAAALIVKAGGTVAPRS